MTRIFSVVVAVMVLGVFAAGQIARWSSERLEVFGGFFWLSQDLSLPTRVGSGRLDGMLPRRFRRGMEWAW